MTGALSKHMGQRSVISGVDIYTEMYPCDVTGLGACSIAEEEMKLYGIKKA